MRRGILSSVACGFLACSAAVPLSAVPKQAFIEVVPKRYEGLFDNTGNVEAVFDDGHKEVWTHDGNCHLVHVSIHGDVGWAWMDRDHLDERLVPVGKDKLVVRRTSGKIREFPPYPRRPENTNRFIMDWRFSEDGSAVILRSMGYHGPPSYVEYLLDSGTVEAHCEGYTPYNQLPAWAKPLADAKND
jgi:hypothetical protein